MEGSGKSSTAVLSGDGPLVLLKTTANATAVVVDVLSRTIKAITSMTTTPIQKACAPVYNHKSVVPSGHNIFAVADGSFQLSACRQSYSVHAQTLSHGSTNNNILFYHFLSITVAFISTDGTVKTINQQRPWWSRSVCEPNTHLSSTSSSTRPRTTALFDHGESVLMSLTIAHYIVIILVLIIITIIIFC